MTPNPKSYDALLRTGKWFGDLDATLQGQLLDAAQVRPCLAGTTLFTRGDAPDGLYCTLSGAIRIFAVSEAGKEAVLTLLEAPSWFGEIALFDGLPRTHDAVAHVDSVVLHVPQGALDTLLSREPRHWRTFGLLLTHKLRLALIQLEDLALLPASTRLARRLVMMSQGYGDLRDVTQRRLEVNQEQLALMLSISRQTANALLKDLERRALIRVSYGVIELLDLEGLRAEAQAPG